MVNETSGAFSRDDGGAFPLQRAIETECEPGALQALRDANPAAAEDAGVVRAAAIYVDKHSPYGDYLSFKIETAAASPRSANATIVLALVPALASMRDGDGKVLLQRLRAGLPEDFVRAVFEGSPAGAARPFWEQLAPCTSSCAAECAELLQTLPSCELLALAKQRGGEDGLLPLQHLLQRPPPWRDTTAVLRALAEVYPRAWLLGASSAAVEPEPIHACSDTEEELRAKLDELQTPCGPPPSGEAQKEGSVFGTHAYRFVKLEPHAHGCDCSLQVYDLSGKRHNRATTPRGSSLRSLAGTSVSRVDPPADDGPFELRVVRDGHKATKLFFQNQFELPSKSKELRDQFFDAINNVVHGRQWFQSQPKAVQVAELQSRLRQRAKASAIVRAEGCAVLDALPALCSAYPAAADDAGVLEEVAVCIVRKERSVSELDAALTLVPQAAATRAEDGALPLQRAFGRIAAVNSKSSGCTVEFPDRTVPCGVSCNDTEAAVNQVMFLGPASDLELSTWWDGAVREACSWVRPPALRCPQCRLPDVIASLMPG